MTLNWQKQEYFSLLIHRDKRANQALESFVEDLHSDKEKTINKFLCHSGSEDFLWGLIRLLGSHDARVAGNSAYILGTVAESQAGCYRVISLTVHPSIDAKNILPNLTRMLMFDDPECVMNAAGTMGTLAESPEGRDWMLNEECLSETIEHVTALLSNNNLWTASNAALVLARLTIAEEGCEQLLLHPSNEQVLAHLIQSLGIDEAGRGMNAAFAIGRLCDLESGRAKLLSLPDSERMVSLLSKMLCSSDAGASKNACFALSCLASSKDGLHRMLKNTHSEDVIGTLAQLLSAEDGETCWFAAMTLHTLASQPQGCLRLRENSSVVPSLKAVLEQTDINEDLQLEVTQTLEILKKLEKPPPPVLEALGAFEVQITWEAEATKSGFPIKYSLFEGSRVVYSGKELEYTMKNLKADTTYTYRVRTSTEGDDSPLSDAAIITTEEYVPGPPLNLRLLAATTTQLKVGWDPPEITNGTLRMYYVYNADKCVEQTFELSSIVAGLQPKTSYDIAVCASTSKGKGPKDMIAVTTTETGAHAPARPEVGVRGRNELHVSWKAPENPLGKITHYDVRVNGEVVYSGMDLHTSVRRLKPDTEYTVTVSAVTNEGKCESKPTKQRTAKDSYEGERPPLYQAPKKEPVKKDEEVETKKEESTPQNTPKLQPKKKKEKPAKSRSVSASSSRNGTPHPPEMVRQKSAVAKLCLTHVNSLFFIQKQSTSDPPSQPISPQGHMSTQVLRKEDTSKRLFSSEVAGSTAPTPTSVRTVPDHMTKNSRTGKGPLPKPKPPPISRKSKKLSTSTTNTGTKVLHPKHSTDNGDENSGQTPLVGMSIIRETTQVRSKGQGNRGPNNNLSKSSNDVDTIPTHKTREIPQTELSSQLTRMYSSSSHFRLNDGPQQQSMGVIEFEAPLPGPSQTSGMTPSYVQRANTFIAHHRTKPKEPHLKKVLDNLSQQPPPHHSPSPSASWTPLAQLPSEANETLHNKFIPMQYRTQPTHMPGGLKRHATVIQPGLMTPSLEVVSVSRSKTEMGDFTAGANTLQNPSLVRQSTDLDRSPANVRKSHSFHNRNYRSQSTGSDSQPVFLAINPTSSQSKQLHWQSAR